MKTLKRLNLVQLSKEELRKKEMNLLKGGFSLDCCGCGSETSNRNANSAGGYGHSSTGSSYCDGWTDNGSGWEHSNLNNC